MKSISLKTPGMIIFFLSFLLFGTLSVSADMVFITLSIPSDEDMVIPIDEITAFEDGILEPFFDAYHIVSNARIDASAAADSETPDVTGADYILSVDISFEVLSDTPVDLETEYSFIDASSGRVLISGRHLSEEFTAAADGELLSAYILQGRAVAGSALGTITR